MGEKILFFTNKYFKIIYIIYENQIEIDNIKYCTLTKKEIAKLINVSRNTIGNMFKILYEEKYLIKFENNKFSLSDESIHLIEKLKEI